MGWSNGFAEWVDGDTAYLSVAFSWRLHDAYQRAVWYSAQGYKVRAGGPAVTITPGYLSEVAQIGGDVDALTHHNPDATVASRGCPVGCWFCVVPKIEGKAFTLLPDFTPRPILMDNNLSALPVDYQDHIINRYISSGVPLVDAQSGFEPHTFDEDTFHRWNEILRGPWRFACDEQKELPDVERMMRILKFVPSYRKRVYVLIGNEPINSCMERINKVIEWGGEPHVQPMIALNALKKEPIIRHDWTEQELHDVARWANRFVWRTVPYSGYKPRKQAPNTQRIVP